MRNRNGQKIFISILFAFALSIVLTGCARPPSGTDQPVISMRKTACFGECPVYSIRIFENRSVEYSGELHVPLKGQHKFRISRKNYQELISAFIQSNFFEFESSYMAHVTDLPTTYLEFNHDSKSKRITDYYGAPAALKALEKKVQLYVERDIWKLNQN